MVAKPTFRDCDVLVVGGGVAGLAAAGRLSRAGRHVALLEARDRLGGRVDTRHEPDWPIPLERGAEFIHGRPPETWRLIDSAGLKVIEGSQLHWQQWAGGPIEKSDAWERIENVLGRMDRAGGQDSSFEEFLDSYARDLPEQDRALATMFVEGFNAADRRRVSTAWLRATDAAGEAIDIESTFRFAEGYDQLVDVLIDQVDWDRADLHVRTAVEQIRWRRGHVEARLKAADGARRLIRAPRALITLPLGVLKATAGEPGSVEFDPPLAAKQAALAGLEMGAVVKILIRFHEPFWDERWPELGFLHLPDEPIPTWWTQSPLRVPVLTGWVGGPAAVEMSRLGDEAIFGRALGVLQRSFQSSSVAAMVADWRVCNWQQDPLSRGAYSYVTAGHLRAPAELAAPLEETLFFAGEATHPDLSGTVSGAIATGYRAAAEIQSG